MSRSLPGAGGSVGPTAPLPAIGVMDELSELRLLFHRLNNQLGVILANAELLESKAADDATRKRASQVVTGVLGAIGTAKEIRDRTDARKTET